MIRLDELVMPSREFLFQFAAISIPHFLMRLMECCERLSRGDLYESIQLVYDEWDIKVVGVIDGKVGCDG